MLYLITFISIVILIFINGFTDAPNAITTVVSTKVMSFKKSAYISAIFNSLGIIIMCLINFKVANGISSIVTLKSGEVGLVMLFSSIISCSIFSGIASLFGIPTSETHGLIAGLTGSAIVSKNIENINFNEWLNVLIGLVWSVVGTFIIVKLLNKFLSKSLYRCNLNKIKKYQKYCSYSLSFMHGAQDRSKVYWPCNFIYLYS